MKLTLEQRILILESYKRRALDIFEKYKYLLTNPELELHFELSDPNIHSSEFVNNNRNLVVCAIHCNGCIILMLDTILEAALCIINEYTNFVELDEKTAIVIMHTLEHTLLHEMRHDGQPFHLLNNSIQVISSIEYIKRETDADYIANKILIEDFGAPEWVIDLINSNSYRNPMMLVYDQSQIHDMALYYYEFIKTFYCLSTGIYDNELLYAVQSAIFYTSNLYIQNNINDRNEFICIKRDGVFYAPTHEFCYLYNIAFLGINEPDFLDKEYTINIRAELINNDDDSIVFIIGGKRLLQPFTKDIGCYYNV